MFQSLPYEPRKIEATEATLERIYKAAKLGLKGDTLALAAGMRPDEYRRLVLFDGIAEFAEQKGRADGEMLASQQLHNAAAEGDAKAALAILTHAHGWVAKQAITVDVNQSISITSALAMAEKRVETLIIDEALHRDNDERLLTNQPVQEVNHGFSNSNARAPAFSDDVRSPHGGVYAQCKS